MDKTAEYYLNSNDIIAFPKMGIKFNINSTAFTIFGFDIKWYGVIIAFGMLLAMLYCFHRMKEFGIDSDRAIDVILCGLIGGIVGARTYYILFNADTGFSEFFQIRSGGLAIYGGLIGALLIGAIAAKFRKVKLLPFLDLAGMGFLIGQGIGRWGNFTNKEAFGAATDLPWGMATATVQSMLGSSNGPVVLAHPCFLYEFLWCALGFLLLHLYSKHRKFDGEMFLMYTAWYGLGRFFIEGLRTDSLYIGRLRVSQLVAGICVVVAVTVILLVRGHYKRNGAAVLYKDTDESKELLLQAEERIAKEKDKKSSKVDTKIDSVEAIESANISDTDEAESISEPADDIPAENAEAQTIIEADEVSEESDTEDENKNG